MTRALLPNTSAREQRLLSGLVDRTTSHWTRAFSLDGGGDDDADREPTQQCWMMTLSPLRIKKPRPLILTTCDPRTHTSVWKEALQQMDHQLSDLEDRFDDHHVVWFMVACSLGVEHTVYTHGLSRESNSRRRAWPTDGEEPFSCMLSPRGPRCQAGLVNSLCNSWIWRRVGQARQVSQSLHSDLLREKEQSLQERNSVWKEVTVCESGSRRIGITVGSRRC